MTTAKKHYRPRRANGISSIPKYIQEWFAGERAFTHYAHTVPYREHLRKYWAEWLKDHPNAIEPSGLQNAIACGRRPPGLMKDSE